MKSNSVLLVLFVIPILMLAQAVIGQSSKPDPAKVTVKQDGPVHGMWAEDQKCVMAVISHNEPQEKFNPKTVPYVCVYVKDAIGKVSTLPYAMDFQDELKLQIPGVGGKDPRIINMRRLVTLLDAADGMKSRVNDKPISGLNALLAAIEQLYNDAK